jgi:hypothetical protein
LWPALTEASDHTDHSFPAPCHMDDATPHSLITHFPHACAHTRRNENVGAPQLSIQLGGSISREGSKSNGGEGGAVGEHGDGEGDGDSDALQRGLGASLIATDDMHSLVDTGAPEAASLRSSEEPFSFTFMCLAAPTHCDSLRLSWALCGPIFTGLPTPTHSHPHNLAAHIALSDVPMGCCC